MMQTRKVRKHGKNRYRGSYRLRNGTYLAQIRDGGICRYLGVFARAIDAARAFDLAARELRGDKAVLNFPATEGVTA
jgi:EREBP-like factor